ncbi:MAG: MBL fold metallo-hydrolase [Comamonadaceae bacterium]|nr:MAG: MBL fold metallo-hydrolase [Comamonadaceae bacterium]
MLRFCSLGSGSTGNATLIEASTGGRTTRLLVDCGFGLRQLQARLGRLGLLPADIDGIFITHEHGDHIGCVHAFSQRHGTQVRMSEGTWLATGAQDFGNRLQFARDGQPIELGALQVDPFTVPHDAREPLQLTCTDGARRIGVLTDLGHATPHVLARIGGVDALLLESNHDAELLAASAYPAFLKLRVGGNYGHLSNHAAGAIAAAVHHPGLRHVVAAHLSEQNNRPELARTALAEGLGCMVDDILTANAADGFPWLDA